MRNDIHSPKNIIPSDYEFVTIRMFDDTGYSAREFGQHREMTGGKFSNHQDNGGCDVCGTQMNNYAVFYHEKTNKYIRTGVECAGKIETGHEDEFKRAAQIRRANKRRIKGRAATMKRLPADVGYKLDELFTDQWNRNMLTDILDVLGVSYQDSGDFYYDSLEKTIIIIRNLVFDSAKYYLSSKQIEFLISLVKGLDEKVYNYHNSEKIKAEQKANAKPVVEGRGVVFGEVLSVKYQSGLYGDILKMLVADDRGFKVWGTAPASIADDVERGDFVEFTATLVASDHDESFGFFKRPTKASIKEQAAQCGSRRIYE